MNEAVDALCVVDANAAKRSASPRTRDVGGTGHVGDQLPPVRGARVAQGCAGAGVENGGEQPALGAQRCVADRVDAGVDAVQPARGSPPRDCRGAEAALALAANGQRHPTAARRASGSAATGESASVPFRDVDCVDLAMAASLGCPRCPFNTRLCRGCAGRLARALRGDPRKRYVVTRAISSIEVTPARAFCRPSSRTVTMPWERATSEISDSGARCTVSDLISSLITITEKRPMRPR